METRWRGEEGLKNGNTTPGHRSKAALCTKSSIANLRQGLSCGRCVCWRLPGSPGDARGRFFHERTILMTWKQEALVW